MAVVYVIRIDGHTYRIEDATNLKDATEKAKAQHAAR